MEVTTERSAVEQLYENDKLFRTLAESTNVAIFLYRQYKPIYVNPAFETSTGYSFSDLENLSGLEIVHPNCRGMMLERFKRRIAGEAVPSNYTIQYITKWGETRWADLSVTLIQFQNLPTAFVTAIDITERKKAEEQIKQSETELRHILDNLQDTYYRTDLQGRLVRVSPSVHDLLGYTTEEVLGQRMADFYVNPKGRDQFLQQLNQNNGILKNYQAALRRKDGSEVWVSTNAQYYYDADGSIRGVEGTTRDITELKNATEELRIHRDRLEELVKERTLDLEAAVKELESFSYSVSHDLRAPLRSIDGFSQILLEDYSQGMDEHFTEYLQRVRHGAQRMGYLIDDLLQLSRVSSSDLHKTKIDLSALAQETSLTIQEQDPARQVEYRIEPKLTARGDKGLLRVALENLIGNAWKYTLYNTQAPVIEFGQTTTERGKAYFVRDNGAGFNMKYAHKLFGAFQRLHSAEQFEGSGIGLATVKRIVQRHGGEIWAQGEEGRGATFYFTLSSQKELTTKPVNPSN